jgi:hypothetical protein
MSLNRLSKLRLWPRTKSSRQDSSGREQAEPRDDLGPSQGPEATNLVASRVQPTATPSVAAAVPTPLTSPTNKQPPASHVSHPPVTEQNLTNGSRRGPSTNPVSSDFRHRPLRNSSQEIRLIRLSSTIQEENGEDKLLSFEVLHVTLENAPKYLGLSYHWGDPPTLCRTVLCDNRPIKITQNLEDALRTIFCNVSRNSTELYSAGEDICLWVDALCINQDDSQEKSEQVKLMGDIFSNAAGAFGYLGHPSNGDPHAGFRALIALANGRIVKSDGTTETPDPQQSLGGYFGDLFSNGWFLRAWVTQEMVLAKNVVCLYGLGSNHASWTLDIFAQLIYHAQAHKEGKSLPAFSARDKEFAEHAVQVDVWRRLRQKWRDAQQSLNIVTVLDLTRPTLAADDRDKVYSILGLTGESSRKGIPVDYSLGHTAHQVYIDTAIYCIENGQGISLLNNAGTRRRIPDLPTWVPDWSIMPCIPLDERLYSAAGNTTPEISCKRDELKLSVRGIVLDIIGVVGIPCKYPTCEMDAGSLGLIRDPLSILILLEETAHQLYRKIQSIRSGVPKTEEEILDSVWRTMTADRGWGHRRNSKEDRKYYDAFRSQYPRNRGLPSLTADPEDAQAQEITAAPENPEATRSLSISTIHSNGGRVMGCTASGLLCLLPEDARPGDVVAIFLGSNLPYLLRRAGADEYELVGHCYVHGVMDGQLIRTLWTLPESVRNRAFRDFVII